MWCIRISSPFSTRCGSVAPDLLFGECDSKVWLALERRNGRELDFSHTCLIQELGKVVLYRSGYHWISISPLLHSLLEICAQCSSQASTQFILRKGVLDQAGYLRNAFIAFGGVQYHILV